MLYFENDYSEGAHEKVLKHLIDTNMEQLSGYGHDTYCERAKQKIKEACECPDAEIFFISGGTQTNQIVIDAMLQGYEGVIAATTGHVRDMRQEQLNLPVIRYSRFHRRMERYRQKN